MKRGRFISFEGGEGAGKSTQIEELRARLEARGLDVVATREPGGTPGSEAIRALLVEGSVERWHPLTELLLMVAARDDHLRRLIRPALARGAWVITDRFHDSSRVYQGIAGGIGLEIVDRLQAPVIEGTLPDLTLLLDIDVERGLARRAAAGGGGRFEARDRKFHEAVRQGFLDLAADEPHRFGVIDAGLDRKAVAAEIWTMAETRLGRSVG